MNPESRKITKDLREGAKIVGPNATRVFPKNRIAAAMIMGDNYDREDLIACVNSLKAGGIDKLFIAYNGKTRRSLQWFFSHLTEIKLPFLIQKFKWEEDFSLARNQSFGLIPKDEFDWIMWIDSDDELVVETSLDQILAEIDSYSQGVYLRYDYASDPTTGEVAVQQWRERILSAKVPWTWIYPIHEVVFAPYGTQYAKKEGVYIRHKRQLGDEPDKAARVRNRKIISKWLAKEAHPRAQFYFANEAMAEADIEEDPNVKERLCEAAILAYRRFLSNQESAIEDMYSAATRIGDLYLMKGDQNKAIDAYLHSIKIIPDWPDAMIGIARAAMELEDWPRCKSFCNMALQLSPPETASAVTPLTYKYTPYLLRGMANEHLGNLKEALEDYQTALSIWNPPTGLLTDRIEETKRKLAVRPADKDERKSLRGKRPEKSIAFVTAPLVEPWHPAIEAVEGAGGAETCIMRLAPRFAADGWRVSVFGTPGEHRGVDENGVEWWNSHEYLPNEPFSVLVSSRVPEVYEATVAAKKRILWMHDVNVGPRLYPFIDRLDTIVGLTNWHVEHMHKLYGIPMKKFDIIPNGIELDLYDWNKKKEYNDELRMIWSSSPDRGLSTLIALWPTIKSMYPTSRLDIFYGWNIIDKLIKNGGAGYLLALKMEILSNIEALGGEAGGIYQHGRVPQSELSEWQLQAHVWPYPTDFMETFCITAIEMQAAGAIPVTSNLAALKETVANTDLLVDGWIRNSDYQKRWISKFEEVVESTNERQIELQLTGRRFAEQFTWDNSYAAWNDLIKGD